MGNIFCCVQVDQPTVAITAKWGKFDKVLEPGCHCLPWYLGKQIVGHLSLHVQHQHVYCETKTKDNVFVTVTAFTRFRALADKADVAYYTVYEITNLMEACVCDVIRASVPKLDLETTFEQKNDIAKTVENDLKKVASHYGYEIVQTLIVNIEPDVGMKKLMNEINAASQMRVAAIEKAETEKILRIKRAEGDAESKYLAGVGVARQRQAIVDGIRDSMLALSSNVPGPSSKDVMDLLLITRYFDSMKEIGASSKSPAVFVPHGPGSVKDITSQIREGLLQTEIATSKD